MASYSLAQIRTLARTRGDFPVSSKHTNSYVNQEIQTAWAELHELIEETNEGYFDKQGNITTVASQAYIALPSDCWRVKGIDLVENNEPTELSQITFGERNRFGSSTDTPLAYMLTERGIDLYPTPNQAYTLRVTYARKYVPLDEAAGTEMANDWHDYIVWSTICKLCATERRPAGDYEQQLGKAAARINGGATKRKQQEPEYLNLREGIPDWWGY